MPRKIMIVDDNAINRQMLNKMLSDEYEVLLAENGEEALAIMNRTYKELSAVLLDIVMPVMDGYGVLERMRANPALSQIPVIVTTGNTDGDSEMRALTLGANDFIAKPYVPGIIKRRLMNTINLRETAAMVNALQRDALTGLYNREAFFQKAQEMIKTHPPGYYVLGCFDIDNFKVINDQYGSEKGDEVLRQVADIFRSGFKAAGGIIGRIMADNFAVLYPAEFLHSEELVKIHEAASVLDGSLPPISFSIGRYVAEDLSLSVSAMYDRAAIAEASIKGRFDVSIAQYDESMREKLLREQEIVDEMKRALESGQFEIWLQPQYNHSTGALIGSEALVRWRHPTKGLIAPGAFIPIFERNGFIYEMDKYVWEQSCYLLRKWIDSGLNALPISVNVSRYDVFRDDLIDTITELVRKYDIPRDMLRLEITESAFAKSSMQIISVVKRLIDFGFTMEIDDFGSGYSSLNTLKDVPAQIVKLDMRFLESSDNTDRGGNILESVVRMAKWLGMTVIAEGVETEEQADYLKSIGCSYVQGYLYAKPMPVEQYEKLMQRTGSEDRLPSLQTVDNLNNNSFWDPKSMDTLIFNTYVGGACIFEWHNGRIETLRANEKYAKTIGGEHCTVEDALNIRWEEHMDEITSSLTRQAIERAISTGEEAVFEGYYNDLLGRPGKTWLRTTYRMIARTGNRFMLYSTNENLTAQHNAEQKELAMYERMQTIMDNVGCGILAVVVDGKNVEYIFGNDRYYELHGYTRAEYLSEVKDVYQLIHPLDRQRIMHIAQTVNSVGSTASCEYRVKRRDGKEVWLRAEISTRWFGGVDKPVQFSSITDITSEKIAELEIRSLNENLQNMMDDAPGGFVRLRVDADGRLRSVYVNENLRRMRGMTSVSDANDATDTIHPEDRMLVLSTVAQMIATGETRNIHYRMRRMDGSYIPVNAFGRVSAGEGGKTFINVYYTDLSEREKQELSLRETIPYLLSAVMRYSTDLMFAKDRDLNYICCSPAFARLAGKENEGDIVGRTDFELFPREIAELFHETDMIVINSGEPLIDYLQPIPSPDGAQHYSKTSKYILRDTAGNPIGIYGIGRDITRERTAFEQLRLLTNTIPGGLATYEVSRNGIRIVYFNDGFCNMMGYSRAEYAEISSTGITNITFSEDVPGLMAQIDRLLLEGTPLNYTYRVHTKGGGFKWVNSRGSIGERNEDICSVNVVLFDVTELKLAQEASLIHDQEMRLAMAQMGRMLCEYDPATHLLTVPETFAALYGIPTGEVEDVPDSLIRAGVIDEATIPAYRAFYEAILRGEPTGCADYRDRSIDGTFHWEHVEFSMIYDSAGNPVKAIISVEDTTGQHRQYELERDRPSLGEENLLVHALFNLTTGETLEYLYADGREVPLPERTAFTYGGDNINVLLINDEERERYRALNDPEKLLKRFENGETEVSIDYRRLLPGGEIAWVRNLLRMVRQPGGDDVLLFEYCYNIEEEKTLELINRSLISGNYDYITRIYAATGRYVMLGDLGARSPIQETRGEDMDATCEVLAPRHVHPDDLETTLNNMKIAGIKRNLENAERFSFTYREVQPDGSLRHKKLTQWYLDRERDIIIVSCEDVTAIIQEETRKNQLLEEALKAANEESRVRERENAERLSLILGSVNAGMSATALVDGHVRYVFVNDEYFQMFGYDRAHFEELFPLGMRDLTHPDDIHKLDQAILDTEVNGSANVEIRMRRSDGQMIWVRNISSICNIVGIDGPVYIVVSNDITREREAADNLRISEEQFRIAATIGGREIVRYDIKTRKYYHHDQVLLDMGFGEVIENVPDAFIESGNIAPECVIDYLEFYERIRRGEQSCSLDLLIKVTDGSYQWYRQEVTIIYDAEGNPSQAIMVLSDISELREKEAVYKKWQQSLQQRPPETYMLFRCNLSKSSSFDSVEGTLLRAEFKPVAATFDDRTREYASGYVYHEDQAAYIDFLDSDTLLASYYRGARTRTIEYREVQSDNSLKWRRLTVEMVEYLNSTDVEAYLMFEDIDKAKKTELRNKERAETDPLTGVLNRAAFSEAVERMISGPNAVRSLALMMLDIDGFKLINDTFGHAMGDQVLVDTAKSLRGALRSGDLLGRFGGDEFLVCLPNITGDAVIAKKAEQICKLLHRALSMEVYTSASLGIAVYPRDGSDYATLNRKTDAAMYAVKAHGKNNYAFYDEQMSGQYDDLSVERGADIASALAQRKKRRMLIVDDSKISIAMLSRIFENDFVIETAADGNEALMCVRRYGAGIAVVLLDLIMPGMDGFAVLEKMRASAEMQTIPVIVVSGLDEHETSLRTLRCGAADFVTKPVNVDLLRLRVQSVISKAENDHLRAQNSLLLMHNTQASKYRAALNSLSATVIEYEPSSGMFFYDQPSMRDIAGNYDDRDLWEILLSDDVADTEDVAKLRQMVEDAASSEDWPGSELTVTLKTPSGERRHFRAALSKRANAGDFPERLILTFLDTQSPAGA